MDFKISKNGLLDGMHIMNSLGIRLTGSKAHNDFISYLQDEIKKMGVKIYSDPFYFKRWEEKNLQLKLLTVMKQSIFQCHLHILIPVKQMKTVLPKNLFT